MRIFTGGGPARRLLRSLFAAMLLVPILGLAACGGSDDSSDSAEPSAAQAADIKSIEQLGNTLAEAVAAEKPASLCSHIEPASLKRQFGSKKKCARLLKTQFATVENKPQFQLGAITLDGDQASAEQADDAGPVHFVKVNGKWYINLFPEGPAPVTR